MHTMNLYRIVDTKHDARSRAMRAALDCFAPLALTIRERPGSPDPLTRRAG